MAWTKAKTAIIAGMGVLLAAGTATLCRQRIHTAPDPVRSPGGNEDPVAVRQDLRHAGGDG